MDIFSSHKRHNTNPKLVDESINAAKTVTSIAQGTRVTADIKTDSDIRIAGMVDGDIETKGKLILTETGRITGKAIASEALMAGRFTGELRILNKIAIQSTAFVDGFLYSKDISVEENAALVGILSVGHDVDVLNAKLSKKPQKPQMKEALEQASEVISDSNNDPKKAEPEKTPESRYTKDVLITVTESQVSNELAAELKKTGGAFIEVLGFNLEIFDEPSFSPFFQKFTYVRKSTDSEEEIKQLFEKGKGALETALLHKGDSDNDSQLQQAADKLIRILKEQKEFAVVIGDILLIQFYEGDVQTIAVEIIPEQLETDLKKNPEMATNLTKVYSYLEN
ncbi:MAG: hypothetical protein CL670_09900 [Balneola sp.]|jgi:cytoskeletal protein CcmA (bactofilin family)|nr:hypothetical protein [Balneola sp.]MBE79456.1 hypothetical protein [Balneola sp.]|tara:strand:- start:2643 stop:3656 length:1014 start_codon:yes stop_codon:yes gene_type:complete